MRLSRLKISAILGAGAILAVSLTACGGSGGGGAPNSLVVYSADPANAKMYQSLLDQFGAKNSVKVQLVSYPSADFIQNFTSAVNGKSQIDALLANGQDVRYLKSKGLIKDIGGVVDTSGLLDVAYKPFQLDSGQYAVGIGSSQVTVWVYNADIFTKYGLTPPKTMQDVLDIANKLKGTGIAPVSVPGGNIYLWPIWIMQMLQQTTNNTPLDTTFNTIKSENPSFAAEQYVKAFDQMAKLGSNNVFANGYQGLQEDSANTLFADGKAAMFFGGTWDVSTIIQQAPSLNVKMVPFPNFQPGVTSASFGGVGIAAAAYSKAPDSHTNLVNTLIKYMTSADVDKTLMGSSNSGIGLPAVRSVAPAGTSPLQAEIINNFLPTTVTFLDWYWPKEVTAAFQKDIQAVVGGAMTSQQAVQDVQSAFNTAKSNGWTFS